MKLSQKTTIIAPEKLHAYLLNFENPDGASKANFLKKIGFERSNWQILEKALREQHLTEETSQGKKSLYGTKYEISAPLNGPNGQQRMLRSVWIIRTGESIARFITLIPEKKS